MGDVLRDMPLDPENVAVRKPRWRFEPLTLMSPGTKGVVPCQQTRGGRAFSLRRSLRSWRLARPAQPL